MDQWRKIQLIADRQNLLILSIYPSSASITSMEQNSFTKEKQWRPDIGETVHEDTTPKDIFPNHSLAKHFMAGGIAGIFSRTLTAPIDRIKVFIQVNKGYSIRTSLAYLYHEGGILSFWRGNGINVAKIAPESAFKFMAYEDMKRSIKWLTGHNELNMCERFIAGGCAGAFAQTMIYPMEVLKTRLALRKTGEGGFWTLVMKMSKEGKLSFYKGFIPNLIGIFPYAGIDLTVYETIKNWWIKRHPNNADPGVFAVIACGIVSSTCGQLLTYPLALVRTRLQALGTMTDKNQSTTMRGQFRYIILREGYRGLYRGFLPNALKVMPAVSISYVTYEYCRRKMGAKMS